MLILVINCGSSSVKYKLLDMKKNTVMVSGLAERIGIPGSKISQQLYDGNKINIEQDLVNHKMAIEKIFECITDKNCGAINDVSEINAIGHRMVHGGERFNNSVLISEELIQVLETLYDLAPLHNPPNVVGIKTCQALLPQVPQVAVFDTAFHQTIPDYAYIYALPYKYYEKYKIRKYGFHGTSHKYVSGRAAQLLQKNPEDLKLVICHLGNGSSITAVANGVSIDTSMGFTPLAGLPMGTRTGDLDPAIIPYIMEKENLSTTEINDILNKKSGALGISGLSSDFRDLEIASSQGDEQARLALNIFVYNVRKWIGAFSAAMEGLDAVVFTGGIGENGIEMRADIVKGFSYLGLEIDHEKNHCRGKEVIFSTDSSTCAAMVIPTNEELMIAMESQALL